MGLEGVNILLEGGKYGARGLEVVNMWLNLNYPWEQVFVQLYGTYICIFLHFLVSYCLSNKRKVEVNNDEYMFIWLYFICLSQALIQLCSIINSIHHTSAIH